MVYCMLIRDEMENNSQSINQIYLEFIDQCAKYSKIKHWIKT